MTPVRVIHAAPMSPAQDRHDSRQKLGHAFGIHHVLLPLWQHGAWSGLVGVGESQVSLVGGVGVIPGCVMVSNGKGGVLKTSLTANVAGLAAASGWRGLAVGPGPPGHLGPGPRG